MLQYHERLDRTFGALADPGRRRMVERLAKGPASVSELAQPLDMTLTAVVQHLHVLEDCGLVRTTKVGRVRTCMLDAGALNAAARWIGDRKALWQRRLDRLEQLLEADDDDGKRGGA